MNISIIAAIDNNRLIGNQNQLPWHLPADLAHFKALTIGKPVVMGRKTFESIGKPLPNRRNIIISKNMTAVSNTECFVSLQSAIEHLQSESREQEIMIIGGATIFQQALLFANKMYLTIIDHCFAGDTFFPTWPEKEWREISREHHAADSKNKFDYCFVEWIRVNLHAAS